MLKELDALVDQLRTIQQELLDMVRPLSPEKLRVPFPGRDWSIQDQLAHLAANESLMTDIMASAVAGKPSPLPPDFNNDRFNAETVARAKDKPVDQVLRELAASREKLLDLLEGLTQEQLAACGAHPLEGELTVKEFLVVMYAHEAIHTREIVEQARRLKKQDTNQ